MDDFAKQVLDILNIGSFVEDELNQERAASALTIFTIEEDSGDPLREAWICPGRIEDFVNQSENSPMESLARVRLLLGSSVWQEELGVNMQQGLERLMHSLATGEGWMNERGWGGAWADETGAGDLPFALVWSLYLCAAAYRISMQNGDAVQAAKVLPWYARALLLLKFCGPSFRRAEA